MASSLRSCEAFNLCLPRSVPLSLRVALFSCLLVSVAAVDGFAATLKVCKSGCSYATLQPAIDAALPGDTILLRAGETFVGPFILRAKPESSSWITIRSDASDSSLPAAGVRLVPSGKPGGNTSLTLLPRLLGQGGALKTTPVIKTAAGAHHYLLKFLEIDGSAALGFETLILLGSDTTSAPPHDIVLDRVYAHGHKYKGMKRGITINSVRTDILNSYISDIKAVNADSQAIAGYNGAGPFKIVNNYLEAAGENVLFGGSDPAVTNLVPSNIEIRRNRITKPLAWRNAFMGVPASARAAVASGSGSLASGTHYFKVVALMTTDNATAVSVPSNETSVATSSGKAVALTWSSVPGADRYRIYRGTSAGAQSRYLETSSTATSFTYSGASEKSGTPPTSGTKWTVKNLLELKNAEKVVIDGNVIENIWKAGQYGYALVLTPRNQYGAATWVRVRDVTITNNVVRHVAGVLQLSGTDATHVSQQTQRITLRNNLFYDINPAVFGVSVKVFLIGEGPAGVVLDHNTIIHSNTAVVYAYGADTTGFVYTNNIALHGTYGIMGGDGRPGLYTINMYFPSSKITNNVLAGGNASVYPTPNSFPTITQWNASFVDAAGGDYRLKTSSVFYTAGASGSVPGANIGVVNAALAGTAVPSAPAEEPPPAEEPSPTPSPNTAPTARPGGPYSGVVGTRVNVDGSGSSDPDGSISSFRWMWGDEIVVQAADTSASTIVGSRWARVSASGAAGGVAFSNANKDEAKRTTAASAPSSYVDVKFYAAAGVPYHLWFRMRAGSDSYNNDSMFVQFSDAVDSQSRAINRIGTSAAGIVILEEGYGAGVAGWGWNDEAYGGLATPVYFATSGIHTIRVQQREDGIMWDELVLSAKTFKSTRPGLARSDDNIVDPADGSGMVTSHIYPVAGQYPLRLIVTDNDGATAAATGTVVIK